MNPMPSMFPIISGDCPDSGGLMPSHVLTEAQMAWFNEWSKPWHGKAMTMQALHEFARELSEQLRRARVCMEGMRISMERGHIDIGMVSEGADYEVTHRSYFGDNVALTAKLKPWRALLGQKPLALQILHDRTKPYCLESGL